MLRVRNAHTAPIHVLVMLAAASALTDAVLAPGQASAGEVDETHPAVADMLAAGLLVPDDGTAPPAAPRDERMPSREELDAVMAEVAAAMNRHEERHAASHARIDTLQSENAGLRSDVLARDRQIAALAADLAALTAPDSGGPATTGAPIETPDGHLHLGGEGPIRTDAPAASEPRKGGKK